MCVDAFRHVWFVTSEGPRGRVAVWLTSAESVVLELCVLADADLRRLRGKASAVGNGVLWHVHVPGV